MSHPEQGLIEVIPGIIPDALHHQAWNICSGTGWYFGNRSTDEHSLPFWKMDLDGVAVFDAIWKSVQARCEQLAGRRLRVARQYANGHTFGLGGAAHRDDERPGCYTLLYFPMREWEFEWQGETVFFGADGEIIRAVLPRPNQAVFFEARIPHAGRAPSRNCPELRVTVAFKLEPADESSGPQIPAPAMASRAESHPWTLTELEREGAKRVYRLQVSSDQIAGQVAGRLKELGQAVRIPGYRPGKIPLALLESRYGSRARTEVLQRISAEVTQRLLSGGSLPASLQWVGGEASGDAEFRLAVTHLPDLGDARPESWSFERLIVSEEQAREFGMVSADLRQILTDQLKQGVLDQLDAAYPIPLAEFLVTQELERVRQAAGEALSAEGSSMEERDALNLELRAIAERRVRLGAVIVELARRHRIASAGDPALEARVLDWLLARARIVDRVPTPAELRDRLE